MMGLAGSRRRPVPASGLTRGFTLAELLVVIVVIGILAAIAVPVFLSQADRASDTALKSDLTNAAKLLQVAEASGETIPSEITAGEVVDLGSAGTFTSSQTLTVSGSGETLCVEGVSGSGDTYSVDLSEGLRNYDCNGNINGASPGLLYESTTFTRGSDQQVLLPTVTEGDGSPTAFSVEGTLPQGVQFDSTTGAFTGPAATEWHVDAAFTAPGSNETCVVTPEGRMRCLGRNTTGELGDGTTTNSATFVDVVGLQSGVVAALGGFEHACALTDQGAVKCWGRNTYGQLGDGTTNDSLTPVDVVGLSSTVTAISTERHKSCALLDTGAVECWGDYLDGPGVTAIPEWSSNVAHLSSSTDYHTCVVFEDSSVACRGLTGNGVVVDESGDPVSGFATVDTGHRFSCGTTTTGGVKCWGQNHLGQLGDGATVDRNYPADVLNPDGTPLTGVETLVVGLGSACVLTTDKDVKCWGRNHVGQIGDGTTTNRVYATDTIGLPNGIAALNAGWSHMCVTVSDGTVNCWGRNLEKQLGDGSSTYRTSPVYTKGTGPQGFPASVDVTVSDDTASTTRSVRLMAAAG